jgi:hypothetical protein
LILRVIINRGSKKVEIDAKRLQDQFVTLKMAIEEAIIKGQKSMGDFNDIPSCNPVSNEHFALIHMNAGSGVIGWVDDF